MHPNRRTFIKTAMAAALAGVRVRAADTQMFVSLNSSLMRSMPWPEFAHLASTTGYPGVDVDLKAARGQGVDATRTLLRDLKLKPGVINFPVNWTGAEQAYRDGMAGLPDAATFAKAIECPRMITVLPPSSGTPKAEFRALLKDRLQAISDVLAKSNVRLGLEFLGPLHFRTRQPYEFIWRMDEALQFATECGTAIGLLVDAWHWHHAHATADDIIRAGRSRIVHIHVSDAKAQPPEDVRDNQRLLPGEGIIDLVTFFRALRQVGYSDAVSPEPLGRIPADMSPAEGARLGLTSTLAVIEKALSR
jgi:sugar phosphate isomerase/epimerase